MAIIILGKSKCVVCGAVLLTNPVGFPPLLINPMDAAYHFNDAACHWSCFVTHPLKDRLEQLYEQYLKLNQPGNPFCRICAKPIEVNDCFALGGLTSDTSSWLFQWNFLLAHHGCLSKWPKLSSVIAHVRLECKCGKWDQSAGQKLIKRLCGN